MGRHQLLNKMNKDYCHISMVLDRSGSMSSVAKDTIGGFNNFINEQRKELGACTVTLLQFDTVFDIVHDAVPVGFVPPLTMETYQPRGYTALYDAIGQAINSTGKFLKDKSDSERPNLVVFVILTDGCENSSREFTQEKVFEMIKHQQDVYKWKFVFIGANQDAMAAGGAIGIRAGSSINYAANPVGSKAIYAAASGNIRMARSKSACGQSVNCISVDWTDEQRKEQLDAGAKTS